jgi:hypothetical protein
VPATRSERPSRAGHGLSHTGHGLGGSGTGAVAGGGARRPVRQTARRRHAAAGAAKGGLRWRVGRRAVVVACDGGQLWRRR